MSVQSIQAPYRIFQDVDGNPLEDGYVYIGTSGLDPVTNPITVYWDSSLSTPASQPIRTIGGFPSNSGTRSRLYVNSDYSITVKNKNGSQVFTSSSETERLADIHATHQNGGVAGTVSEKLDITLVGSAKESGVKLDGSTDDTAAWNTALNADDAEVYAPTGRSILTSGNPIITKPVVLSGSGPNTILSCDNSSSPTNNVLRLQPGTATTFAFTGTLTAGQRAFTLSSVSGLSVGQMCLLLLGTDPYDGSEEHLRIWTIINDITGLVVTVSRPLPEAVNGTSHSLVVYDTAPHGSVIQNLGVSYEPGTTQNYAIIVDRLQGGAVRQVYGWDHVGSVVDVRECSNIIVDGVTSIHTDASVHSSAGRLVTGWGNQNCVFRNIYGNSLEEVGIFLESQCRDILLENIALHINPDYDATTINAISITGGSRNVHIRNYTFSGASHDTALQVTQSSEVSTENFNLTTKPKACPIKNHSGFLRYNEKTYRHHKTACISIALKSSWSGKQISLPEGMYKKVQAYITDTTNVTTINLSVAASGIALIGTLVEGATKTIGGAVGFCGSDYAFNDDDNKYLAITTGAVDPGAMIRLYIEYMTTDDADDTAHAQIDAEGKIEWRGQLTISDTATLIATYFPGGVTLGHTDYHLKITPTVRTGSTAVGSARISEVVKYADRFVTAVEVAPGAGTSQTFDWELREY